MVPVQALDYELDERMRNRQEAVALMAQPLPYGGFERAFAGELQLDMRPASGR